MSCARLVNVWTVVALCDVGLYDDQNTATKY